MKSLLLVTVLAVAASICYADDVKEIARIGNKALYIINKEVTGDTAKATCEANGLVSGALENQKENDAISAYLKKRAESNESSYHAWLGGNDEESEGSFVWNYSNKPIGPYNNWSGGAPQPSKYNKCIYMSPGGEWIATYCELKELPVCQKAI